MFKTALMLATVASISTFSASTKAEVLAIYSSSGTNVQEKPVTELDRVAQRVRDIRFATGDRYGAYTQYARTRLGNDDVMILGCDAASAARNNPTIDRHQLLESYWFAAARGLSQKNAGYNYSATIQSDKSVVVDSFLGFIPKPEYQASEREVAWHCIRVKQLHAQSMPLEKRIETMTAEAKLQPWRK